MEILSLEDHIKELASKNSANQELYSCWLIAKIEYAKLLETVKLSFPFYSRHDVSHSQSIIHNIERILGSDGVSRLGITDTWLLLECAHIHDLGMVLSSDEVKTAWNSQEFSLYRKDLLSRSEGSLHQAARLIKKMEDDQGVKIESWPIEVSGAVRLLISDYFRKYHARRSERDYNEKWMPQQQASIIKKRISELAARIAMLHGEGHNDIFQLQKCANGQVNDYIHPRFIATLLRLGDVLDLDNSRFDEYVRTLFSKELPMDSKVHYAKHESVNHFVITPQIIEVIADCKDVDVYFEMNSWMGLLNDEIKNATLNWIDIAPVNYPVPPKVNSIVTINNKRILNGFENIKYDISQEKMFEIIRGGDIYQCGYVFIRELIQNSLDASKLKLWNDLKAGKIKLSIEPENMLPWDMTEEMLKDYIITINIEAKKFNEGCTQILFSISDNGVGITTSDVNRIARIGNSWRTDHHKRGLIENMPVWLRPTGSFGVGMQSAFLYANEISIHTVNEDMKGMMLRLRSYGGGNEQLLVMEDDIPEGYRTKVSVEFIVKDDDVFKNRPFQLDGLVWERNVFKEDHIELIWELRIKSEARSYLKYSFFPMYIKGCIERQEEKFLCDTNFNSDQFFPMNINSGGSLINNTDEYPKTTFAIHNNLKNARVWDSEENVFLWYDFFYTRSPYIDNGEQARLFYKEIEVARVGRINEEYRRYSNMPSYYGRVFNIIVSSWGWDAKECLMLNRESFKPDYDEKIRQIIESKTTQLMSIILKQIQKEVDCEYDPFSIYFMFLMYANTLDWSIAREILKRNGDRRIRVLKINDNNKYKKSEMSVSEIISEYPHLYFANLNFEVESSEFERLALMLNGCKVPWIVYETPCVYWFLGLPHKKIFNNGHLIHVYSYTGNGDDDKDGINPNDMYWKYPVIQSDKYPELIVSRLPYVYTVRNGMRIVNPPYILQPYGDGELEDWRSQENNEDCFNQLTKHQLFDELVNYVFENQKERGKYSVGDIREGYRRFFDDRYALLE